MEYEYPVRHYIQADKEKRIIALYVLTDSSEEPKESGDILNWTQEGGQSPILNFADGTYSDENPPLTNDDGVCLYKWDDGVYERTPKEIEDDTPEPSEPPPDPPPSDLLGRVEKLESEVETLTETVEGLLEAGRN